MSFLTLYKPETGEIVGVLTGNAEFIELNKQLTDLAFLDGEFDKETYFIHGGQPKLRPPMPVTFREGTITGIPVPATLKIRDQLYEINEPTVEVSFEHPGIYLLILDSWPYLPAELIYENPSQ